MSQSNNRRVIESHSSPRLTGDGANPWMSGLWSGLQALAMTFFLVVLPIVAAYVATSDHPANAGAGWLGSIAVGVQLWLLGHGGTIASSLATFTIIPVGLMMAILAINWASVRRTAVPQVEAGIAHALSYVGAVAVLGLLLAPEARNGLPRAVLGAFILAGIGATLGIRRIRRDADPVGLVAVHTETLESPVQWLRGLGNAVPPWAIAAMRAAIVTLASLIAVAALLIIVWILVNREVISTLMVGLHADPIGAVALTLGQVFLIPNLVMWAGAWVVGTGFSVGAGTIWSPFEVTAAPLPAIPLLGALPESVGSSLTGPWVVALPVLCGAVAGLFLYRKMIVPVVRRMRAVEASASDQSQPTTRSMRAPDLPRWRDSIGAAMLAALLAGLMMLVLNGISGGISGPGRLSEVGAQSLLTAAIFAGEVFAGVIVATVATRPEVTGAFRQRFSRSTRAD